MRFKSCAIAIFDSFPPREAAKRMPLPSPGRPVASNSCSADPDTGSQFIAEMPSHRQSACNSRRSPSSHIFRHNLCSGCGRIRANWDEPLFHQKRLIFDSLRVVSALRRRLLGFAKWRRGWDSNPRYPEGTTVFETAPFDHSGTSPQDLRGNPAMPGGPFRARALADANTLAKPVLVSPGPYAYIPGQ